MEQIISLDNNDVVFTILKKKFINLNDFECKNNIITYKNKTLDLGKMELRQIDQSLFNLNSDIIYYTLVKEVTTINNPEILHKQVAYMNDISNHQSLEEMEKNFIQGYSLDFLYENDLNQIFSDETLENDLNERIIPINGAYEGNITEGKELIQDIILKYNEQKDSKSNSQTKGKARVLSKNDIAYYDYPEDIENEVKNVSGFANNVLLIIIIIILGIVLAYLLFNKIL